LTGSTNTLLGLVRGGLHCMQHIRGHDLVVQVDLDEYHRGHRYFIGFHANLGLRGDHRGGGVRADQGCEQADLVSAGVPGVLTVLPSSLTCISAGRYPG
jgi:hypothetical protein